MKETKISEKFRKEFRRACHCSSGGGKMNASFHEHHYSTDGKLRFSIAASYSPSLARTPPAPHGLRKKATLVSISSDARGIEWTTPETVVFPKSPVVLLNLVGAETDEQKRQWLEVAAGDSEASGCVRIGKTMDLEAGEPTPPPINGGLCPPGHGHRDSKAAPAPPTPSHRSGGRLQIALPVLDSLAIL